MSFSLSSKCWLGAVLAVALGLTPAWADGQSEKIQFSGPGGSTNRVHSRPGEKIQFSGTADDASSGVDNGTSRFNSEPGAFRQTQEAIFAPFVNMMRQRTDSMQGVLAMPQPQPRNTRPSERERKLLDQRRNWAFSDYNDLNGGGDPLDSSQPGSTSEDKSVSLVERYYQRLGRQQPNAREHSLKEAFDSTKGYSTHDEDWDSSTGADYTTDKSFLKQLDTFGVNARKAKDHGADDNTSAMNPFGNLALADQNTSAALEAQQRRNDFQKILNPSFVPTPAKSSLNPIYSQSQFTQPGSSADSLTPATATVTAIAPAHRNPLNLYNPALADPSSVAFHSSVFDNPTAAALGLPNPVPVTPQPQPMTLEKMQSMIDPTAVFKKHNF